jgi:hypothetical protein
MLELYVMKVTRTVLRRERRSNPPYLADSIHLKIRRKLWLLTYIIGGKVNVQVNDAGFC